MYSSASQAVSLLMDLCILRCAHWRWDGQDSYERPDMLRGLLYGEHAVVEGMYVGRTGVHRCDIDVKDVRHSLMSRDMFYDGAWLKG